MLLVTGVQHTGAVLAERVQVLRAMAAALLLPPPSTHGACVWFSLALRSCRPGCVVCYEVWWQVKVRSRASTDVKGRPDFPHKSGGRCHDEVEEGTRNSSAFRATTHALQPRVTHAVSLGLDTRWRDAGDAFC